MTLKDEDDCRGLDPPGASERCTIHTMVVDDTTIAEGSIRQGLLKGAVVCLVTSGCNDARYLFNLVNKERGGTPL